MQFIYSLIERLGIGSPDCQHFRQVFIPRAITFEGAFVSVFIHDTNPVTHMRETYSKVNGDSSFPNPAF